MHVPLCTARPGTASPSKHTHVHWPVVFSVTERKGWDMALFGNKKPKLPSYVGVGLDALLQDPQWAYAISQAGIDTRSCEIVLRPRRSDGRIGVWCPRKSDTPRFCSVEAARWPWRSPRSAR